MENATIQAQLVLSSDASGGGGGIADTSPAGYQQKQANDAIVQVVKPAMTLLLGKLATDTLFDAGKIGKGIVDVLKGGGAAAGAGGAAAAAGAGEAGLGAAAIAGGAAALTAGAIAFSIYTAVEVNKQTKELLEKAAKAREELDASLPTEDTFSAHNTLIQESENLHKRLQEAINGETAAREDRARAMMREREELQRLNDEMDKAANKEGISVARARASSKGASGAEVNDFIQGFIKDLTPRQKTDINEALGGGY